MAIQGEADFLLQILPSLLWATFCGTTVGFERGRRGAAAGMKTQVFICVGAAIFTNAAMSVGQNSPSEVGRMLAQIASGVGFLGAGTIMAKDRIIGLTTAAVIWVMAGLGILAGIGYGMTAGVLSLGMVAIIEILSQIEKRFVRTHQPEALHHVPSEVVPERDRRAS